jgi:uncharacterized protein YbaA (DUF1428 family)
MAYVDGYVLAVKKDRLDEYRKIAADAADVWKDYGALRTVEAVAEDVPHGELTSFPRAVQAAEDEVVIFSWIEYPDKATRDACNEKVMQDPRMQCDMSNGPMNGKTMIYGGFTPIVDNG